MNQPGVYICSPSWTPLPPPSHPIPQGHPSASALSTLSHASNLDWRSVSHMVIYMFQCYSLRSSHPRLLPQRPKDCSIHLCLFCCLAYRVIVTIFLNTYLKCFSSEFCFFQVVKSFLLQFVWDYLTWSQLSPFWASLNVYTHLRWCKELDTTERMNWTELNWRWCIRLGGWSFFWKVRQGLGCLVGGT